MLLIFGSEPEVSEHLRIGDFGKLLGFVEITFAPLC